MIHSKPIRYRKYSTWWSIIRCGTMFYKKYNAMPANLKSLRKTLFNKTLYFLCSRCTLELEYICAMAHLTLFQTSAMKSFCGNKYHVLIFYFRSKVPSWKLNVALNTPLYILIILKISFHWPFGILLIFAAPSFSKKKFKITIVSVNWTRRDIKMPSCLSAPIRKSWI